jgi:hypothetical protein
LKLKGQSAILVDREDPVIPDQSKDTRFSRRDRTGYAQLGTLTMFKQDGQLRGRARRVEDQPPSRREASHGRRTDFEDGVLACSERTSIPAGHLKFVPVETRGVAYNGTVHTEMNVCDWAFIPRGLYTCHRGKTLIAVFELMMSLAYRLVKFLCRWPQ